MAVDSRLVTVMPYESERVVPHRLDVVELDVASFDECDGALMPLTVRARAKTSKELVRVDTSVSVGPVDFHDPGPPRRAKLNWLVAVIAHGVRPSQRPEAAPVRSRTPTVACWASSWSRAS
jgi:hypothetical protein